MSQVVKMSKISPKFLTTDDILFPSEAISRPTMFFPSSAVEFTDVLGEDGDILPVAPHLKLCTIIPGDDCLNNQLNAQVFIEFLTTWLFNSSVPFPLMDSVENWMRLNYFCMSAPRTQVYFQLVSPDNLCIDSSPFHSLKLCCEAETQVSASLQNLSFDSKEVQVNSSVSHFNSSPITSRPVARVMSNSKKPPPTPNRTILPSPPIPSGTLDPSLAAILESYCATRAADIVKYRLEKVRERDLNRANPTPYMDLIMAKLKASAKKIVNKPYEAALEQMDHLSQLQKLVTLEDPQSAVLQYDVDDSDPPRSRFEEVFGAPSVTQDVTVAIHQAYDDIVKHCSGLDYNSIEHLPAGTIPVDKNGFLCLFRTIQRRDDKIEELYTRIDALEQQLDFNSSVADSVSPQETARTQVEAVSPPLQQPVHSAVDPTPTKQFFKLPNGQLAEIVPSPFEFPNTMHQFPHMAGAQVQPMVYPVLTSRYPPHLGLPTFPSTQPPAASQPQPSHPAAQAAGGFPLPPPQPPTSAPSALPSHPVVQNSFVQSATPQAMPLSKIDKTFTRFSGGSGESFMAWLAATEARCDFRGIENYNRSTVVMDLLGTTPLYQMKHACKAKATELGPNYDWRSLPWHETKALMLYLLGGRQQDIDEQMADHSINPQLANETVDAYLSRKQMVMEMSFSEVSDSSVRQAILTGLRPEIRASYSTTSPELPFQQRLRMAEKLSQIYKASGHQPAAPSKQPYVRPPNNQRQFPTNSSTTAEVSQPNTSTPRNQTSETDASASAEVLKKKTSNSRNRSRSRNRNKTDRTQAEFFEDFSSTVPKFAEEASAQISSVDPASTGAIPKTIPKN